MSKLRRFTVIAVVAVTTVLAVYVILSMVLDGGEPEITLDDFVGAEACGTCHPQQYAAWVKSTHGRAGGSPQDVTLLGKFNGEPLVFKDAVVIPRKTPQGQVSFTVKGEGVGDRVFPVNAVVGGGFMAGGGTQSYFSLFPDGTLRFLPFDFIRDENTWFVQLKKGDHWVPVSESISLDDLKNWPPHRILGSHSQFSNCQNCHGSQLSVRYDQARERFDTRYTTLRINCESCHGPGREHAEKASSGNLASSSDIELRPLDVMPRDESLQICFQCHATKDLLKPGYLPGKDFEAYYSLKFPVLGSEPYLVDGRVRAFAYQQNHLYSDCYLSGSMTCVDCHDPHALTYRDIHGRPLEGRFDNGQCVGCHASKAQFVERHTHHPADSPASLCTSCHMPYFQHRGIGSHLRYARSDHTVSIPRPVFDAQKGLEGACQQCHRDKSVERLQSAVDRWYGPLKSHNRSVKSVLEAQEVKDAGRAAALLLSERGHRPLALMMGLSRFVKHFLLEPEGLVPSNAVDSLTSLSQSSDPDIQGLALAALVVCCEDREGVSALLEDRMSAHGARLDPVGLRWGLALDYLGSRFFMKGKFAHALELYRKAHAVLPQDPSILTNQGHALFRMGKFRLALEAYRKALERDPSHREAHHMRERLESMQGQGLPEGGLRPPEG